MFSSSDLDTTALFSLAPCDLPCDLALSPQLLAAPPSPPCLPLFPSSPPLLTPPTTPTASLFSFSSPPLLSLSPTPTPTTAATTNAFEPFDDFLQSPPHTPTATPATPASPPPPPSSPVSVPLVAKRKKKKPNPVVEAAPTGWFVVGCDSDPAHPDRVVYVNPVADQWAVGTRDDPTAVAVFDRRHTGTEVTHVALHGDLLAMESGDRVRFLHLPTHQVGTCSKRTMTKLVRPRRHQPRVGLTDFNKGRWVPFTPGNKHVYCYHSQTDIQFVCAEDVLQCTKQPTAWTWVGVAKAVSGGYEDSQISAMFPLSPTEVVVAVRRAATLADVINKDLKPAVDKHDVAANRSIVVIDTVVFPNACHTNDDVFEMPFKSLAFVASYQKSDVHIEVSSTYLACSVSRSLWIWHRASGSCVLGHYALPVVPSSLHFAPDEHYFVAVKSGSGGTIFRPHCLWSAQTKVVQAEDLATPWRFVQEGAFSFRMGDAGPDMSWKKAVVSCATRTRIVKCPPGHFPSAGGVDAYQVHHALPFPLDPTLRVVTLVQSFFLACAISD